MSVDSHSLSSQQVDTSSRLNSLRNSAGILSERQQREGELHRKLKIAITNALFLDKKRKQIWLKALYKLKEKRAKNLLNAILRENFRYKKNIRALQFKVIPERAGEETKGDI
jgi:hypothetical protein